MIQEAPDEEELTPVYLPAPLKKEPAPLVIKPAPDEKELTPVYRPLWQWRWTPCSCQQLIDPWWPPTTSCQGLMDACWTWIFC